jgi:putative membrane protein
MRIKSRLIAAGVSAILSTALVHAAEPSGKHFIQESIEGNLAEVKIGDLAQHKGASQGVKDFGAALAKDHAGANEKAKQAAAALGVTPASAPNAKQKAMYMELSALSGEKFDQHFIKSMIKDHQEDISKYEQAANSGSGPAADYAKAVLPDLRKHLEMAQSLEKEQKTAGAAGTSKMK